MNRDTSPTLSTAVCVIAILSAFLWVQHDDARAKKEDAARRPAAQERRATGAERACGPNAEPVWVDSTTVQCLRRVDSATVARSTL